MFAFLRESYLHGDKYSWLAHSLVNFQVRHINYPLLGIYYFAI